MRDTREPARLVPVDERIPALSGSLRRAPHGARTVALLRRRLSLIAHADPVEVTAVLERRLPAAKELDVGWP